MPSQALLAIGVSRQGRDSIGSLLAVRFDSMACSIEKRAKTARARPEAMQWASMRDFSVSLRGTSRQLWRTFVFMVWLL
ncbi:hypothetical protein D0T23_05040 [Duganella sp. BJB475]|nr:hypothetical protein D0T23_05040 [Duganella sp. BJB475]